MRRIVLLKVVDPLFLLGMAMRFFRWIARIVASLLNRKSRTDNAQADLELDLSQLSEEDRRTLLEGNCGIRSAIDDDE